MAENQDLNAPVLSATAMRRLLVLLLLALWEALPRLGLVPALFLPPPSAVLQSALVDWREFGHEGVTTLSEIAAALAIACVAGTLAGALVGSTPALRRLVLPLASSLYALPLVILYPLFTVWLGLGPQSKIAFGAVYGFFPTMLAAAAGIRTIPAQYMTTARSMGASRGQTILHIVLPAAIPPILTGIRLGGALVIVGVIVAEMLASASGIGFLISRYRTMLDSPRVFLGISLVLALTIAFDMGMRLLEAKVRAWQPATS